MYRIYKQRRRDRIPILLKQSERIFHTQDLGLLWGTRNPNTLHTTISRYIKRDILFPLTKGMYATTEPATLDPRLIGLKSLHGYGYISCETILFHAGVINQPPREITMVGSQSRRWDIGEHRFRVRKMKDGFLFHPAGIREEDGIRQASLERAITDLLYFHPYAPLDAPVNWSRVQDIQDAIGYPLTPRRYATSTTH